MSASHRTVIVPFNDNVSQLHFYQPVMVWSTLICRIQIECVGSRVDFIGKDLCELCTFQNSPRGANEVPQ